MSFQALPAELLCRIIVLAQQEPTGFESFALTCRSVFSYAKPYIGAHSQRKRHWRRTRIGAYPGYIPVWRPHFALDFVYSVAVEDPWIPAYVEKLEFDNGHHHERDYEMWRQTLERYPAVDRRWKDAGALSAMKKLVAGSPYLRAAGVDVADWVEKMFDMYPDSDSATSGCPTYKHPMHTVVYILTLLDNVTSIKIDPESWNWDMTLLCADEEDGDEYNTKTYPELGRVLDLLIRKANEKTSRRDDNNGSQTSALSKLRSFSQMEEGVEAEELLYDYTVVPLRCHARFLALRSLTSFRAEYTRSLESDSFPAVPSPSPSPPSIPEVISKPNSHPDLSSNLRALSFRWSNIPSTSLTNLLTSLRLPRLESFIYIYDTLGDDEVGLDVAAVMESLGACCGESLTHLTFSLGSSNSVGRPVTGDSFQGLKRLQSMRLDGFLFLPGHHTSQEQQLETSIPALNEVLPPSVRRLRLHMDFQYWWEHNMAPGVLRALLRGFQRKEIELGVECWSSYNEGGESGLPHMRKIAQEAGALFLEK